MSDYIDRSVLSNLDGASVRIELRIKDSSFKFEGDDGVMHTVFVDDPWSAAPIFNNQMRCPLDKSHKWGEATEPCECTPSSGECDHAYTICGECIDSWAMDYYFRIGLVNNGEVIHWSGLNDVPGYQQL